MMAYLPNFPVILYVQHILREQCRSYYTSYIFVHYISVQYLLGQFYSDEVYREHTDWERKTKLGHGVQASCFSVCDNKTQCILVLKEVFTYKNYNLALGIIMVMIFAQNRKKLLCNHIQIAESKKALKEAYIALKFARQSNPSPYIVEFYTAALFLGSFNAKTCLVQIFMEQVPGRLIITVQIKLVISYVLQLVFKNCCSRPAPFPSSTFTTMLVSCLMLLIFCTISRGLFTVTLNVSMMCINALINYTAIIVHVI